MPVCEFKTALRPTSALPLTKPQPVVLRSRRTQLPAERRDHDGEIRCFDLDRIYALSATRDTLIPGIRIPSGRPVAVAIQVLLPPDVTEGTLRFEVIQQAGKLVVGGSTCVVRPQKSAGT